MRASADYASAVGVFGGAFVPVGLVSIGLQIDVPIVDLGEGAHMPLLATAPCTLKWVFPVDVSSRPSR